MTYKQYLRKKIKYCKDLLKEKGNPANKNYMGGCMLAFWTNALIGYRNRLEGVLKNGE